MRHLSSHFILFMGCCMFYCLPAHVQADGAQSAPPHLYLGIEKHRFPYTYLDKDQQPGGILVESTRHICKQIDAACDFVANDPEQNLENLHTLQLNGIIIIDSLLIPETDQISLTPPLCTMQPVYIHRQDAPTRGKPEDFKGAIIGVQQGSLLHLYLLDAYNSFARLKPYPTLESGVFDLTTGRIDALFSDNAFFQARVANNILGQQDNASRLVATPVTDAKLPATSMSIAIREQDKDLMARLTKAIQASGKPKGCSELLNSGGNQAVTPAPPLPASPVQHD